jgi:hypothetical protein
VIPTAELEPRRERVTVVAGGLVRTVVLGTQLHVQAEQPEGHALVLLRAADPAGPWAPLLTLECNALTRPLTWSVTGDWAERENFVRGVVTPCPRLADGSLLRPASTTPALGAVHQWGLVRLVDVVGVEVDPAFNALIALP